MEPRSTLPIGDAPAETDEDREELDRDAVRLVAARNALELVLTPERLPPELLELPLLRLGVLEPEEPEEDPAVDCTDVPELELELEEEDEPEEPPPPDRPPRPRPLRLPRIIGAIREAYLSAAVTPVRRNVRSSRPVATTIVGTL